MKKTTRLVCGFFCCCCKNEEKDDCVKYSLICWLILINEIGYKTQFVMWNFLLVIKKIYMFYKILLHITNFFFRKLRYIKQKKPESIFFT
jgi:hypothetical protein